MCQWVRVGAGDEAVEDEGEQFGASSSGCLPTPVPSRSSMAKNQQMP
jgi:hypothetical protein